ncbi:hypothetical protein KFK09_001815 [Dendrobium nobile]|uniref:Uncharacterized protein n=1 Tax=Dendrobium nobile TaxID=94219 RepID=A0A8T3C8I0_DENNO|nr:hypothetical protein KFK09_001815 [Dendrobium nobile]
MVLLESFVAGYISFFYFVVALQLLLVQSGWLLPYGFYDFYHLYFWVFNASLRKVCEGTCRLLVFCCLVGMVVFHGCLGYSQFFWVDMLVVSILLVQVEGCCCFFSCNVLGVFWSLEAYCWLVYML